MSKTTIILISAAVVIGGVGGYLFYRRWERKKIEQIVVSQKEAMDIINNPNLK